MQKLSSFAVPRERTLDWRLFGPLVAHLVATHAMVGMARVTMSYRTIELGLPSFWPGLIAAAFATLPILFAVQIGRFIDRGNDARALWLGSGASLLASVALWMSPSSAGRLLVCALVLGIGHMFLMASQQMLTIRSAGPDGRETAIGYFMVANTVGQGVGPFLVGWLAGRSTVPPTGPLFGYSAVMAALCLAISAAIRPAPDGPRSRSVAPVPIRTLLVRPGVLGMLVASAVTVTSGDLLVIYLPLLGVDRSLHAQSIGQLLMARSIAALAGRLAYTRLIDAFGRFRLSLVSTLIAAGAFALLAVPRLSIMYVAILVIGIGLGVASTLTISGLLDLVPTEARGTVLALRLTGNRLGLMSLPLLAGVVTSTIGTFSVLLFVAVSLGGAAAIIGRTYPRSG